MFVSHPNLGSNQFRAFILFSSLLTLCVLFPLDSWSTDKTADADFGSCARHVEIVGYDAELSRRVKMHTGVDARHYPWDVDQLSTRSIASMAVETTYFDLATLNLMEGNAVFFSLSKETFYCPRVSRDHKSIEFVDIIGRRVYYQAITNPTTKSNFRRVSVSETAFATSLAKRYPLKNTHPPELTDTFLTQISMNQLFGSTSWQAADRGTRARMLTNQITINRELFNKLQSNTPVTREDLECWAELVLEADPDGEEDIRRSAWVIRGTAKEFQRDGTHYKVDMGGETSSWVMLVNGRTYMQPTRGPAVPKKIDEVLALLNGLDASSAFEQPLRVYRNYLIAHPSLEGNGRVARSLLDGGMVKIGYPPAPAFNSDVRLVLYADEEAATLNLLRVYDRAPR